MTFLQFLFIILTVFILSIGQILFKLAAVEIEFSFANCLNTLLNFRLLFAFFIYFIATIMWLFVLKDTPLRVAYPFSALAFFFVPTFSYFFLGENLNWNTFIGAGVIAIGVWISVYH